MTFNPNDPRWTAYVLDELSPEERREVEQQLNESPQARELVEELRFASEWLGEELQNEPLPALTNDRRRRILQRASAGRWLKGNVPTVLGIAATVTMIVGASLYVGISHWNPPPRREATIQKTPQTTSPAPAQQAESSKSTEEQAGAQPTNNVQADRPAQTQVAASDRRQPSAPHNPDDQATPTSEKASRPSVDSGPAASEASQAAAPAPTVEDAQRAENAAPSADNLSVFGVVKDASGAVIPGAEIQATEVPTGEQRMTITNDYGHYTLERLKKGDWMIQAELTGFRQFSQEVQLKDQAYRLDPVLQIGAASEFVTVTGQAPEAQVESAAIEEEGLLRQRVVALPINGRNPGKLAELKPGPAPATPKTEFDSFADRDRPVRPVEQFNTEAYDNIQDNPFLSVLQNPRSTFSIDVDTASYANLRRFLNQGQRPPKDAVRIEEMVNYFQYGYAPPTGEHPFAVHLEIASAPWNPEHRLLKVGLKGKEVSADERPAANLVFLIDVSGSMRSTNKLPLLKQGMKLLVDELADKDRVAIAVYAGAAGLVLPSTPCTDKERILASLDQLQAGGSTAGAAGIRLAYQTAQENFIRDGINRVILATDGDFNVGVSSDGELVRLIEEKRQSGVFLSVLGFGMGNYKDSKLEKLADKGNGNYAYIDNLREARKVLVEEMGGTLMTIAKDVKIQIEFNPTQVDAYRLIGYENRLLAAEDFNDDTKDAGEIGAGHTVTALYELVPPGQDVALPKVDPLKYQAPLVTTSEAGQAELATVKLRYKQPDEDESRLIEIPLRDSGQAWKDASRDFMFAAGVAAFGMILRDSPHKGSADLDLVTALAESGMGRDPQGRRAEFLSLVKSSRGLLR